MIQNLKILRQLHGISQKRLAESVGTTQQSINKYENHKTEPDIDTLIRMADFFHTSVDFLIGRTESMGGTGVGGICELSADEIRLIGQYRKLKIREKDSIHLIMENYCE